MPAEEFSTSAAIVVTTDVHDFVCGYRVNSCERLDLTSASFEAPQP
jgi:hypothetical protein